MPTFHHGKDSQLLIDEYDLSRYFNDFSVTHAADTQETSGFGIDDKEFIPGMRSGDVSLTGMWVPPVGTSPTGDTSLEDVFEDALGVGSVVFSIAAGGLTAGQRCMVGATRETQWDITQSTSSLVTTAVGLQGDGPFGGGYCLADISAAVTGSGNGSSVDEGAQSTDGGIGVLHVISSDGTATIKIQDSPDDAAWADLITFNATATPGGQSTEVAGTVDRYVRALWTLGTATSITFAVTWRRNP